MILCQGAIRSETCVETRDAPLELRAWPAPAPRQVSRNNSQLGKCELPHWISELTRVTLPLAFVALVAAAVAGITSPLFFAMVISASLVIVVIRALFPAGRLFPVAFASLIAVYAAISDLVCSWHKTVRSWRAATPFITRSPDWNSTLSDKRLSRTSLLCRQGEELIF